jgi:hypothetical protein
MEAAVSKLPPIPKEQRSFPSEGARDRLRSAEPDRRDHTGVQSPDHGGADVDVGKEGRYGNMRQNLTPQRRVQDR